MFISHIRKENDYGYYTKREGIKMFDKEEITPEFIRTEWDHPIAQAEFQKDWDKGIVDEDIIVAGATQNFKQSQEYDKIKEIIEKYWSDEEYPEVENILDAINEDYFKSEDNYLMKPCEVDPKRLLISNVCSRNWDKPFPVMTELDSMSGFQPNTLYIRPRAFGRTYKSSLWIRLLALGLDHQSYSIDESTIPSKPITTVQLKSVIHWGHSHPNYLEDIKIKDNKVHHALEELVGYNDLSPISQMIVDSFKVAGPEMLKQGKLVGPNFNEDKKRLERSIKNRRKKK